MIWPHFFEQKDHQQLFGRNLKYSHFSYICIYCSSQAYKSQQLFIWPCIHTNNITDYISFDLIRI